MKRRTGGAAIAGLVLASRAGFAQTPAADSMNYAIYAGGEAQTKEMLLAKLKNADVIFIGENHDDATGHEIENTLLQELVRQNHDMALSLEMFERDTQNVLDEYLHDIINESSFLQAARPWPRYKTDYRPLIEFCKAQHIPVIAANAPRRYVNIVSRKGQDALLNLPRPAREFLPPLPIAMSLPAGYDKQLDEIFSAAHGEMPHAAGTAAPVMPAMPSTANMKQAQAVWDAAMADSILRYRRKHTKTRILQINGAMHSDHRYGIVDRLYKSAPNLRILTITLRPDADFPRLVSGRYDGVADFVILTKQPEKQIPASP